MALSNTRKRFRVFLGLMLCVSLCFFSISAYFYVSVKNKHTEILDIAPTLFQIDIYGHQAYAMFQTHEGRYKTASELYRLGFFSYQYSDAGKIMMEDLAKDGYKPAQDAIILAAQKQ